MANERFVGAAELTQVSRVRRQDVVIRIEDDHRLGLMLQKRDQGLHLVWTWKRILGGRQAVCHRGSSEFIQQGWHCHYANKLCQWQLNCLDIGPSPGGAYEINPIKSKG
ncbi:hypothetical protein THH46_13575 [Pseudomonas sp. NA13]